MFETLIRPPGYFDLIESDKAYAPSTMRHINRFHLVFEAFALLTFVPEFRCALDGDNVCNRSQLLSRVRASTDAVLGDTHAAAARGHFILGLTALRFFGVVRHWKQMWINNTFRAVKVEGIVKLIYRTEGNNVSESAEMTLKSKKNDDNDSLRGDRDENDNGERLASTEEDQRLKNAATIGTALMVVNSQRSLVLLYVNCFSGVSLKILKNSLICVFVLERASILIVLPLLGSMTQQNLVANELAELLQANNEVAQDDCSYFESAISSWINIAAVPQPETLLQNLEETYVLWAQVLPVREDCSRDFQREDGVITFCDGGGSRQNGEYPCHVWDASAPSSPEYATEEFFAEELGIRLGGILTVSVPSMKDADYNVTIIYNQNPTVSLV